MQTLKVIYDTDPGVDDAMALLLLARHRRIELIGVTTVFGNADIATTTRNALYLKQKLGFSAPVAGGAGAPLVGEPDAPPTFVHGMNGLGDIELADITETADPRPAHQLIIDLVKAYPGEVTIIAVGRMTNLERAMREAPEIVWLVKQVVVMGGAFGRNGHTGNVTPVAEANIWGDPDAADIVFGAAWPIAIAGLDVTQATVMTEAYVAELATAAGKDGAFVRAISAFYQNFHRESAGLDGFYVHDSSAVALALHPEFYKTETGAIRVVTEGIAIGQTIIKPDGRNYPPGAWDGRPSQTIAVGVDAEAVLKFYRDTLVGERLMYGLIGRITTLPGKRDELIAILTPGGTMAGCISYVVAKATDDADAIYVTEVWESSEAHGASLALPQVQDAISRGRLLIAKFETIAATAPVGGIGI